MSCFAIHDQYAFRRPDIDMAQTEPSLEILRHLAIHVDPDSTLHANPKNIIRKAKGLLILLGLGCFCIFSRKSPVRPARSPVMYFPFNNPKRPLATCTALALLVVSSTLVADTLHIAEDVHIDLGNPTYNVGTVPNLIVSNLTDRRTGERLTLLSFALPPLPEGSVVEQAWLRLFVGKVGIPGTLDLYLVNAPWNEHTVTANTAPAFGPAPFASMHVTRDHEGHFIAVDVTPEVSEWLEDGVPGYGFLLAARPGALADVSFDSKENAQTSHASELEVVLGTAPGSIDSEAIADNSIGSDDIADGSISSEDVDSSAIQLRVSGTCAAGSSIRVIDETGGVTCEPDDDSGGDITSVQPAPGGGLQGGADTGDAQLGIAPGGVNSAMIADGSIVAADVDNNSLQVRVGGSCPPGQSIRAISNAGGVTCEVDDDTDTTLDPSLFWQLGGNTGTNPIPGGTHFLGTTDDTELVLAVNGVQGMRLAQVTTDVYETVNVLGGHAVNRIVNAQGATIGGGGAKYVGDGGLSNRPNKVEASFGTVSGGVSNGVMQAAGTIGGGWDNLIHGGESLFGSSVIGGGSGNVIDESALATIGGGWSNDIEKLSSEATISGGSFNKIVGVESTIGGGSENEIHGQGATIAGGWLNRSFRNFTAIGGGSRNEICNPAHFTPEELDAFGAGQSDVIAGGASNRSCAFGSFIGSGFANTATGLNSMIIGGAWNRVAGRYSLAAGHFSEALENYGIALGYYAHSLHHSAFVWADATGTDFNSQRENQVRFRASGGVRFDVGDDNGSPAANDEWVDIRPQAQNTFGNDPAKFRLIDTSTGAYLSLGGGWVNASDRDRKTDIRAVDPEWVLQRVVEMPISTWRYNVETDGVRHIGPMAQDFHATFGLGGDPKGIMSVDADGVALAAIQALYRQNRELQARVFELEARESRLENLEAGLLELQHRLASAPGLQVAWSGSE